MPSFQDVFLHPSRLGYTLPSAHPQLAPFQGSLCPSCAPFPHGPWEIDSLGEMMLSSHQSTTRHLGDPFPLQGTLLDTERPQRTLNQNLELRFQYSEDSRQQWFVIYTKQLSSQDGA